MEGLKKLKFKHVPTFKGGPKDIFPRMEGLNLGGDLEVHVEAGIINDTITYLTIQFNYIPLNLVQAKFEELVENEAFSIFKGSSNTI